MKTHPLSSLLCALFLSTSIGACDDKKADGEKSDKAAEKKADEKKADEKKADGDGAGGDPKEGGSCKGISATDGLIACDGNKIIFCSSYSDYKWTKQNECTDGTKCVAEGKTASCK